MSDVSFINDHDLFKKYGKEFKNKRKTILSKYGLVLGYNCSDPKGTRSILTRFANELANSNNVAIFQECTYDGYHRTDVLYCTIQTGPLLVFLSQSIASAIIGQLALTTGSKLLEQLQKLNKKTYYDLLFKNDNQGLLDFHFPKDLGADDSIDAYQKIKVLLQSQWRNINSYQSFYYDKKTKTWIIVEEK